MVDLNLWWGECGSSDKFELRVADEFPCQPEEGLLEVVVRFGGDVVVLEVLLAVESDGLGLDFALLDINFVSGKDDWDVFAHADKVTCNVWSACIRRRFLVLEPTMPIWDVLVCNSGSDVEHNDAALAIDVVAIS